MTVGCSASFDISVQGKTSTPHTEECRNGQMEHDPEGHERLQVHKHRRDVESEVEVDRAPVARQNEGDPAPLERQDVEMLLLTLKNVLVCASEQRTKEARNTTCKTYWNPRPRRGPG